MTEAALSGRPLSNQEPGPYYETFVIRLCADFHGMTHGEIRHIPTGSEVRFRHINEALDFMKRFVPLENTSQREGNTEPLR